MLNIGGDSLGHVTVPLYPAQPTLPLVPAPRQLYSLPTLTADAARATRQHPQAMRQLVLRSLSPLTLYVETSWVRSPNLLYSNQRQNQPPQEIKLLLIISSTTYFAH